MRFVFAMIARGDVTNLFVRLAVSLAELAMMEGDIIHAGDNNEADLFNTGLSLQG